MKKKNINMYLIGSAFVDSIPLRQACYGNRGITFRDE